MKKLFLSEPHGPLTPFEWTDIPAFAVLTGANGVGKTQLLELLSRRTGSARPFPFREDNFSLELDGAPRAGYLPARWGLNDLDIVSQGWFRTVQQYVQKQLHHLRERAAVPSSPDLANELEEPIDRAVHQVLRAGHSADDPHAVGAVLALLGPHDLVVHDAQQPLVALAHVILGHLAARVTHLLRRVPYDEVDGLIGPAPWDVANELLRDFGLPYRLKFTDDLRLPFELHCYDLERKVIVKPSELSSGEQSTVALVALVTTTTVLGGTPGARIPEMLILDEPDAHLHTALVKGYLGHLRGLVERGVQIIMVTHRPDTIALAPDEALFEMRRDGGQTSIVKVASKNELISRLAADTIAVLPSVRIVLTEGSDDSEFHQAMYERAVALGLIPRIPPLEFKPVNRNAGGKGVVLERVASLRTNGLESFYRGLIDRDGDDRPAPPGIRKLVGYAIESYFADPLALYCTVVSDREVDGRLRLSKEGGIGRGELGTLRDQPAAELQRIADVVILRCDAGFTEAERVREDVVLRGPHGPVTLRYPRWVRTASKQKVRGEIGRALDSSILREISGGPELAGFVADDLVGVYRQLATERQ